MSVAKIPDTITSFDIEAAIGMIRRDGVPGKRKSRGYCLVSGGAHFPPKYVISVAYEVAEGKPLGRFMGGEPTNGFLKRRGFEVVACICGGVGVGRRAGIVSPRPPERSRRPRPSRPRSARRDPRPVFPSADRLAATQRFYMLLDDLAEATGGPRRLDQSDGYMDWPTRGVYFFFEPGEKRSGSGTGPRVVRVGTHAVAGGEKSTLWKRLRQHRGSLRPPRSGNHRSSIFRRLVGDALGRGDGARPPESWRRRGISREVEKAYLGDPRVARAERAMERRVSRTIGRMPFLWLGVTDEGGRHSDRPRIERNAIALLSAFRASAPDPSSGGWLGLGSSYPRVRRSGLWNQNHVNEAFDPSFLDVMERWLDRLT